jgi:PAS domain S-box-containing protein
VVWLRNVPREHAVLEDHHHLLTEYSAVQQALSELAAIYNDAPIGMAVIGMDFRFQRINARLAQINGAPVEAHIGRTMREVVPKLAEFGEGLVRKIAETGESILNLEIEGETDAEPGAVRSFVEHWSPVLGADGGVVAVNVVVEEVTAQKRAAEALRASDARLREVLDSITEAFLVMDHDYRVIQVNREALRIDGRPASEMLGRTQWQIWPTSVGTPVEAACRRVMSERVPVTLEHHFVSDARELWLDISAYPTTDGIALFYRDITERKRSEERLRESERRLSTALRAGQLGVFEYNYRPSPSYYWDKTVRQIWGVGPNDTVTDDFFWSTVHPNDVAAVRKAHARSEDPAGARRYDVEYRIYRRSDNALRWVKIASDVVFDGGAPVRIIGTIQDITDMKQAEEQALLLMREVNHRSKNLLAVVQSIAHQMARGGDPETFTARFAERLTGLAHCQDLLVRSHWQGVDLRALITNQLAHYQDLIGSRIHLAGEAVRVSANTAQNLGMALHELATNAAKYGALSAAGGDVAIAWAVSAAEDEFSISWTERGGPPVAPPDHKGLGSQIITRLLERAVDGSVTLDFDPAGLRWSARAPASAVLDSSSVEGPGKQAAKT